MIEKDVTFLILCPDLNTAGLKDTVKSIKTHFPEVPYYCIVGSNAKLEDLQEINKICSVLKAENTITSLLNFGVKKSKTKWCFTVMSGCFVKNGIFRKYNLFLNHDKEILYSVVDLKSWLFMNATINGMLLSRDALLEIGSFPNDCSIPESKAWWQCSAVEKGYKLKGIVGTKL